MDGLFIAGIPRSGTTLLADMLGAGLKSVVTPESQFLDEILPRKIKADYLSSVVLREVEQTLQRSSTFRRWGIEALGAGEYSYPSLVEKMIIDYSLHGASGPDALSHMLWIDHTPSNALRYTRMKQLASRANFIVMYRDPRAIYSSVRDLDWGPSDVRQFVQWWLARVAPLVMIEKNDDVTTIFYESLVSEGEETLKLLASNLEICSSLVVIDALGGGGFRVPKYTKDQHGKVGGALNVESLHSWRSKLSEFEVSYIEYFLNDYMELLNYPLICANDNFHGSGEHFGGKRFYRKVSNAVRYLWRNRL